MKNTVSTTEIICDNCRNMVSFKEEAGKNNYPYSEGWLYLHNLEFKHFSKGAAEKGLVSSAIETHKDKHFCSVKCMKQYIQKKIDEVGK